MTVLIAVYQGDQAALNIADKLIKYHSFKEVDETVSGMRCYANGEMRLLYLDTDDIYADELDRRFPCDAIIFGSRHKSNSQQPTLTTHVSGNLNSEALLGGSPKRLALSHPQMMRSALTELMRSARDLKLDKYSVSLEATHHGPTELGVPSFFVEIGSTEQEWSDPLAGEAAARAIFSAATNLGEGELAVGFGGGHYSTKHTQITLNGKYCVGHILPKYFFSNYDPDMVKLAFERTIGKCGLAVVDWKGISGAHRQQLLEDLERLQVDVVRV